MFHVKPFVNISRDRNEFTVRESPSGLFEVLFHGAPVDMGVPIECPYEADAFLRALQSDLRAGAVRC